MFEQSEAFDLFISEVMNEKTKNLSETDGQYAALKSKIAAESEKLQSERQTGCFPEQDYIRFENFCGLLYEISSIECEFFYKQGYLDCVQLLKTLGVC